LKERIDTADRTTVCFVPFWGLFPGNGTHPEKKILERSRKSKTLGNTPPKKEISFFPFPFYLLLLFAFFFFP